MCVEVRERRCGRGVGEVVCGNVDRLDRGDRAVLGRGDALLQLAHLGRERGLVANRGRHAAEKRRDLGACLREAEDVVDEEQHVLALVAEVLGSGQAGQTDAQTRSGRLVHLTVDEHGLLDDTGLLHLEPEVGALTSALADAGEDRRAAVLLGEVVDELHDDDGLADTRTAEEPRLAALDVGLEEVDDLDAGLEDLRLGLEVLVLRGLRGESGRNPRPRASACRRPAHRRRSRSGRAWRDRPASSSAPPVSTASMPRVMPSVDDMATARTWLPGRCCCTSATTST